MWIILIKLMFSTFQWLKQFIQINLKILMIMNEEDSSNLVINNLENSSEECNFLINNNIENLKIRH